MGFNDQIQQQPAPRVRTHITRKKRMIIGLIALVVIIGVGTGVWFYMADQKSKSDAIAAKEAERVKAINQTANEAQKLSSEGNVIESLTLLDKTIKVTDNLESKGFLLLVKANVYFNNGSYDEALAVALESEAIEKNDNIETYIAQIYMKKGDKQNAIKYYQLAITYVDKSSPMSDANIKSYQDTIKALGDAND